MKAVRRQSLQRLTSCLHQQRALGSVHPRLRATLHKSNHLVLWHTSRFHSTTASAAAASGAFRQLLLPVIAGAGAGVSCGTAAYYLAPGGQRSPAVAATAASCVVETVPAARTRGPVWARELAQRRGMLEVMNGDILRQGHPLLSKDHMVCVAQFSALVRNDMLESLSCYYHPEQRHFHSVLELGTDVCGYKSIVHGGLTAAICDETFGGLLFALRRQRALPFWGPAFTAQLDITYRAKISSSSAVLCTAEVESIEGRKVWLRAIVSDGPDGKVFATARALFVAPKPQRLIHDGLRLMFPGWPLGK